MRTFYSQLNLHYAGRTVLRHFRLELNILICIVEAFLLGTDFTRLFPRIDRKKRHLVALTERHESGPFGQSDAPKFKRYGGSGPRGIDASNCDSVQGKTVLEYEEELGPGCYGTLERNKLPKFCAGDFRIAHRSKLENKSGERKVPPAILLHGVSKFYLVYAPAHGAYETVSRNQLSAAENRISVGSAHRRAQLRQYPHNDARLLLKFPGKEHLGQKRAPAAYAEWWFRERTDEVRGLLEKTMKFGLREL